MDLDAYFRRIGTDAAGAPSLATLTRLIERHQATLPFENIETLCGRVPALDLDALQRKMLLGRRGGYCFEQNTLFMAVLSDLGYAVRGLEGRVRTGVPAEVSTARTHMALGVTIAGKDWLVDVGFGAFSPPYPLRLEVSVSDGGGGDASHRFVTAPHGELLMQARSFDGWTDGYLIMPSHPLPIDYEMGNWWTATYPNAMLRKNLLVSRAVADGGRLTLFNRRLTLRRPLDGAPQERELRDRNEIAAVLAEDFNLDVAPQDLDAIMERPGLLSPSAA
ncbi:arylamine N-acetyltransferase [Paucibacter sp. R3-3]|uniref:Arylamine N-acetyltransferase n=1 Tax=Roseateles agri TaxID=3098619 RepID=A0ABU5DGU9_9BURK|nr:arylamine N-acetyltransferase [Paucibacter sp. R3-3]MDY0744372.1 arylamine N-acetyltransferase [Paucibacter sp. R3-3]